MKRKIISYILIGALSAVCLCGCGENSSGEKETRTAAETVESSNEETENDLTGSSSTGENETVEGAAGMSGTENGGQDTDAAGTSGTENGGQDGADGASGNTKDAADSHNTSAKTADSDALDVSWGVIEQYGFNDKKESILTFNLKEDTVVDCGDFYTIEATFYKPVLVSLDHEVGDIIEIVTDELTGERRALTYKGNGTFVDADNIDYRAEDPAASGPVGLYYFSDDRVETAFYEGVIMIAADAESCIDITGEKAAVSAETLSEDSWYNGVVFNDKKQAVTLTIYGD